MSKDSINTDDTMSPNTSEGKDTKNSSRDTSPQAEGYEIKPLGKCESQEDRVFVAVDLSDGESRTVLALVTQVDGVRRFFPLSPMPAATDTELKASLDQVKIGAKLAGNLKNLGDVFKNAVNVFNQHVSNPGGPDGPKTPPKTESTE